MKSELKTRVTPCILTCEAVRVIFLVVGRKTSAAKCSLERETQGVWGVCWQTGFRERSQVFLFGGFACACVYQCLPVFCPETPAWRLCGSCPGSEQACMCACLSFGLCTGSAMCGSYAVHVDSICVLVRKREQARNMDCVYVRACVCEGNLRRCITTYPASVTMSECDRNLRNK